MKTSVRNEDAITSAMGWLDPVREDGHAEPVPVTDSEPEPANAIRQWTHPPAPQHFEWWE